MTGDELPDESHTVRYIKPSLVDDGKILADAFRLREGESTLSVHWLECFKAFTRPEQIKAVRRLSRLKLRKKRRFAVLHTGRTKRHTMEELIRGKLNGARFVHTPLDADEHFEADRSHSEVVGLPPREHGLSRRVGGMIAECVEATYPGAKSPARACPP